MKKQLWTLLCLFFCMGCNLKGHGFGASTLVAMKKHSKPIYSICSRIEKNSVVRVLTYDIATFTCCIQRRVKAASEGEANCYCRLEWDDNPKNDILCTPLQEFYLFDKKQWVSAYQLQAGDTLLAQHNTPIKIANISFVEQVLKVYSIRVNDGHNFFVGRYGILTHNMMLPVSATVGLVGAFGSGAAAGSASGSYFGPVGITAGLLIGGGLGIFAYLL